MKVLFIDTGHEYGGGTKSFLMLLKHLDKSRFEPFVWFCHNYSVGKSSISKLVEEAGGNFIDWQAPTFVQNRFKKEFFRIFCKRVNEQERYEHELKTALELMKLAAPQIVHLNNHFGTNTPFIEAANMLKIPVVQHLRKNSKLSNFLKNRLAHLYYETVSVSKNTREYYASQGVFVSDSVIYNPVFEHYTPLPTQTKKNEKIVIAMPANYLPNKGHKIVFEALERTKRGDLSLYIAGSGKFDSYTQKLKEMLKAKGKLVELGFVEQMDSLYQKADYVISFSAEEGLPRVVLEGIGYGCAIIASNINIMHEIKNTLADQSRFFVVTREAANLAELFEKLQKLPKKEDSGFLDRFSLNSYIKSVESVYNRLI